MPVRRIAVAWIATGVALFGASCAKDDNKGPQNKTEYAAAVDPPQMGRTADLNAFRAFLDTFSRGTLHKRIRHAICTDSTPPADCIDTVSIQAIGLSRDIRADSGPARGRVIGVIRNLNAQHITNVDSLKPASQSEYYIYIDRAASGHARWNLLEVPTAASGVIRTIVQNEVHQCGERPGYKWSRSDVDFANCGDHSLNGMISADMLSLSNWKKFGTGLWRQIRGGDPVMTMMTEKTKWYGCPWGCCT
jgi:hypothetical protein